MGTRILHDGDPRVRDRILGWYLFTNDGQIVVTEDALSGIALEKSLDDIPDFNLHYYELDLEPDHSFEYFGGDEKEQLVDFIRFCRLGSFLILRI